MLAHTIPTPYVQNGGHPGAYSWGVAAMPDGNTMIVSDIFNNRVLRYDLTGSPYPPATNGVVFQTSGLGANAYGLGVDPKDWTIYIGSAQCCGVQVWTANDPSHIAYSFKGLIDPTGGPHSTTSRYPARMTVGNDGTVYIADMTLNTISVFSSQATGNAPMFRFGTWGTGNAQFKDPRGMALDGSNPQRLYVVDSGNYRVEVFDTSQMSNPTTHGFLYTFGSKGSSQSGFGGNLRGLAYDRTNNLLYVVDIGKNHVEEWQIDPNATSASQDAWARNIGKPDPSLATLNTCCAQPGSFSDGGREIAIDGTGNLWVGDMPNFRTQVFNGGASPTPGMFQFAAPPQSNPALPAPGQFSFPEGVGVFADGTAVVSDSHNFRLEWFDSPANNYAFTMQEGTRGRYNKYGLDYARNISVNMTTSEFALADTYNNSVHYFAQNGTALWVYGGNGTGGPTVPARPGSLNSPLALPSGVAVDNSGGPNQGDIYIADSGDKRVVVIDSSGLLLGTIVNNGGLINFADPRGLGVDPSNGDLYVADFPAKKMFHFGVSGSWSAKTQVVTLKNTFLTGTTSMPFDVVVDSANQFVYVSDTSSQKILIFRTDVNNSSAGSFSVVGQPEGIALAPNGHLYIASRSNDKVFDYCVNNCP
jgi:DNA-binding beta-propeller fold protein YncE